jgi:hypothetical protein
MNLKHAAVIAAGLVVFGCSPLSGPNNSISNQYSIHLTGRVLDKDGNPMANAVVKLKSKNLCDTTDSKGCYCISEKKSDHKLPDPCKDSLEYCKDGQTITKKSIPNWIDTLPDVYTIQRDIYGGLTSVPQSFGRITATITGADSTPEVAQLWYNTANQSYSGFVYFAYSADSLNYSVCVSVYNNDGVLSGRSVTVTFPSKTAGDINVPAFDPNNACPGRDTTVDTVKHDTVTQTPSPSPFGPVAWWTFDSGSGNTFYDVTGHGFNASWTGSGITTAQGVKGQALSCSGSGYEITVANSCNDFNFTKFSIVTWCYSNTDYSQNAEAVKIFDHQSVDGSGGIRNGYSIHVDPNGQIVFGLANRDGSDWMCARSTTLLKGQTWYSITCTYDSSVLRIYLNGNLDATYSYAGTYVKPIYDARIACQRRTDGSVRYQFNWKIDELKIYDYPMAADSVRAHYNAYNFVQ